MKKSKHTPGPLFISGKIETGYTPAFKVSASIGAGTLHIATFKRKPDAELFIAAPELLAALEICADVMTSCRDVHPNWPRVEIALGDARAAIAKARGQS